MKQSMLGSYIRSLRLKNGLTQAQLVGGLGVTDKAVSKWERDLSLPDLSLLPKLADCLGVTVSDLLSAYEDDGRLSRLVQIFDMSHDIRTPLHFILGCANMAAQHREDSNLVLRYMDSIRISGEYLLNSIERLMDVAGSTGERREAGMRAATLNQSFKIGRAHV